MRAINMRVRVPQKVAANNPEDFMKYYQERVGDDESAQKEMKWL